MKKTFGLFWLGVVGLALLLDGSLYAQKKAPAGSKLAVKAKATQQSARAAQPDTGLVWMRYDEGLKKASSEKKHIMIDFYTTWCGWCKKLDKETYADPRVQKILRKDFVAVKVNAESNKSLTVDGKPTTEAEVSQNKYRVTGFPTIWFLKHTGEEITPLPGFVRPEQFIHIINYIKDDLYEKNIPFDQYVKQQEAKSKS